VEGSLVEAEGGLVEGSLAETEPVEASFGEVVAAAENLGGREVRLAALDALDVPAAPAAKLAGALEGVDGSAPYQLADGR